MALAALLGAILGARAVVFFVLQGAMAIVTLEVNNYVEHYGLRRRRRRKASGRYERPSPRHSWKSPVRFSNALFFNIQRHADHHARPKRPFYELEHIPDAPQLPWGYPLMMFIALVPPLWRAMMDHRVAGRSRTTARQSARGGLAAG